MLKKRQLRQYGILFVVVCFLLETFALSGCESIRKKLRRQKKKAAEESSELPILEPMEYPKKIYTPEDSYKKNFGLWKIWQRDLIESMSTSDNKKRLSYLVGQVTTSLGEMKNLVQEQSRGPLQQAISTLTKFKEDITAPVPRRSLGSWKTDLEMMEKNIRKDFNLSIIKENLREVGP